MEKESGYKYNYNVLSFLNYFPKGKGLDIGEIAITQQKICKITPCQRIVERVRSE